MMHPDLIRILAEDRVNALRRDAQVVRAVPRPVVGTQDVEPRSGSSGAT
jgi:hypothetical protein